MPDYQRDGMIGIHLLLFIGFFYYVGRLASGIARRSLTEWLLVSFLLFTGSVILTGWILSALYLTANTTVWGFSVFVTVRILSFVLRHLSRAPGEPLTPRFSIRQLFADRRREFRTWFTALSSFPKFLFGTLMATLIVIAITNLLLVLFTVPNEWDSMTGHLNRVMQYIQRGTMRHFGGTNWNIDTYPKSVCNLQIYELLGRYGSRVWYCAAHCGVARAKGITFSEFLLRLCLRSPARFSGASHHH
jgi:hypothetical protein